MTSVDWRGSRVPRAKLTLLSRIVAGTTMPTQRSSTVANLRRWIVGDGQMQQQTHPQDGGQHQQGQPQAHQQAHQIASPDVGPARQRGRHQQFVGAALQVARHAIRVDKGQEQTQQQQQTGWQDTASSPQALVPATKPKSSGWMG